MLPVIHGFWLGYVRTVTVGTTSLMHLLMKPMTEVVYSSMTLDESQNIFQSVQAKQSCSLASTSSDHFLFEFLLVSRNQEDRVMVTFVRRTEGEPKLHFCLWSKDDIEFCCL